jgi:hypothetical protein
MSGTILSYDVAGLLMDSLSRQIRVTVTLAGVNGESARFLREHQEMRITPFQYGDLPLHLQVRLMHQSIDGSWGREGRMLHCVNRAFREVNFLDYCTQDWYRLKELLNALDSPDRSTASSRSGMSRQESLVWSPVSRSGSSSSGSDDEDLLAAWRAERLE